MGCETRVGFIVLSILAILMFVWLLGSCAAGAVSPAVQQEIAPQALPVEQQADVEILADTGLQADGACANINPGAYQAAVPGKGTWWSVVCVRENVFSDGSAMALVENLDSKQQLIAKCEDPHKAVPPPGTLYQVNENGILSPADKNLQRLSPWSFYP